MSHYEYGQMGFVFSSVYLTVRFIDLGNSSGVVPLLQDITQSKQTFRRIVLKFFALPQIPCLILGNIFIWTTVGPELRLFAGIVMLLETYRLFLRYLLHAQFKNQEVILIELSSFILFLSAAWIPFFYLHALSAYTVLLAHIADSSLATILLILLAHKQYNSLPEKTSAPQPTAKKIFYAKLYPYVGRLCREITSSNMLTPIYGLLFGYEKISIFYFLGIATTAYQMIIKNTITYSGNALIATLRDAHQDEKKIAFHMIAEKLILMLVIPLVGIAFFYHDLSAIIDPLILKLLFLFLILMGIDLLMHVYEQYYLVQDAAQRFFFFKAGEAVICAAILYLTPTWNILYAFILFIVIKLIVALAASLQAYNRWGLSLAWRPLSKTAIIAASFCFFAKILLQLCLN